MDKPYLTVQLLLVTFEVLVVMSILFFILAARLQINLISFVIKETIAFLLHINFVHAFSIQGDTLAKV